MSAKKFDDNTFDVLPSDAHSDLYKGAHVRQFTSKLRTKVSGPSGEVLYFIRILKTKRYRALVAWRPEEGDHYDQFVDVNLLRLENTPPPEPRGTFGVELKHEPEPIDDENDLVSVRLAMSEKWISERRSDATSATPGTIVAEPHDLAALLKQYGHELLRSNAAPRFCPDCEGALRFDSKLVGDTVGGLTLRGWDVCTNLRCGKTWLSDRAVPDAGEWKLASGGRSVETGHGRIRVDGGTDVETLMARIVKLPELELEVERLRKLVADRPSTNEAVGVRAEAAPSPWKECQLVVNGIELKDGDRILLINQPEAIGNGVRIIRLEKP